MHRGKFQGVNAGMAGKKPDQFGPGVARGPYNTRNHCINLLNTGETGFSKTSGKNKSKVFRRVYGGGGNERKNNIKDFLSSCCLQTEVSEQLYPFS
jgi:hypothetical protein